MERRREGLVGRNQSCPRDAYGSYTPIPGVIDWGIRPSTAVNGGERAFTAWEYSKWSRSRLIGDKCTPSRGFSDGCVPDSERGRRPLHDHVERLENGGVGHYTP
jgi:hypothetical protein